LLNQNSGRSWACPTDTCSRPLVHLCGSCTFHERQKRVHDPRLSALPAERLCARHGRALAKSLRCGCVSQGLGKRNYIDRRTNFQAACSASDIRHCESPQLGCSPRLVRACYGNQPTRDGGDDENTDGTSIVRSFCP
jgi:hypothetical protein